MIFDHILVTTDLSEDSKAAFDLATYQAKTFNGRITLLSVFTEFYIPSALQRQLLDADTVRRMKDEYEQEMTGKLEELAKTGFHGKDITAKAIFSSDAPAKVICEFADQELVNLIVIATSGKGAIDHLFVGSVTEKVIRQATCPLLVVPKIDSLE